MLMGGGDLGMCLPDDVHWLRERYTFADAAARLSSAKASLAVYASGSQSGVQVMGSQCGTHTIVSDVGGLREYLPSPEQPVSRDPVAIAVQLDRLADPDTAVRLGRIAAGHYREHCSATVSARAIADVLARALPASTRS